MRFDPRQTAALLAVLETGSFEAAAQQLHITASAVSQRIRALEIEMGGTLIARTRPCHGTPLGQRLMQHLRRAALLEDDFDAEIRGHAEAPLRLVLAVNADSLATWFVPALAPMFVAENVLLETHVDDQDHTQALMTSGEAVGCVTTQADAIRGCEALPLGVMRYRLMASRDFVRDRFPEGLSRDAMRRAPVVAASRKDRLHTRVIERRLGLKEDAYPCHHIGPAIPRFESVGRALGVGMVPELWLASQPKSAREDFVDLLPEHPTDVALFWHGWKLQSPRLERLTKRLVSAAQGVLLGSTQPARTKRTTRL